MNTRSVTRPIHLGNTAFSPPILPTVTGGLFISLLPL